MRQTNSNALLTIFLALSLMSVVSAYVEVVLNRNEKTVNDIKIWEIATDHLKLKKCGSDIQNLKSNQTVITNLCFERDISFTVETLVGDMNFNYEIAELALDLHSTSSWLKSTTCHSCEPQTKIPIFQQIPKLNCNRACIFDNGFFQSDFIVTNKYRQHKNCAIVSNNQMMYGEYISSKFSFLAYDPEKKKSIIRYIEEQLQQDSFAKYEDLVTFPSLKMIAANILIGYDLFTADGGIGLGLNQIQNGSSSPTEENSDIMQALESAMESIDSRVFGIYINEIGPLFKEYALILGGINFEYSHKKVENIQYVKVIENSGHYWNIPVASISLHFPSIETQNTTPSPSNEQNTIKITKPSGILSLSTSFIMLPKQQIFELIEILNREAKGDCKLVDLNLHAIYCTEIHTEIIQTMEMKIKMENGVELVLDYRQLIRKCNIDLNTALEDRNINDCLFNISISSTNFIILGEPFLKKHYTIFDQEQKSVGFLPAADNTFWGSDFYEETSFVKYLIRVVVIIFILGMIFILCIAQIVNFCKWFKRNWNGEIPSHFSERQPFTNTKDDLIETSYDEIELSARRQALDELRNEQLQQEEQKDLHHNEFSQSTDFNDNDDEENTIKNFEQTNSFAGQEFPKIPQPGAKDLIDQAGNDSDFTRGFNFVGQQSRNNPFDEPSTNQVRHLDEGLSGDSNAGFESL